VRAVLKPDGTASVIAGDTMLVDGAQVTAVRVAAAASGPGYAIVTKTGNVPIDVVSGSLKGLVDLTQKKLPNVQTKLDQLASAFVIEFNNVHRTGSTLSGATNVDFFDPSKITAGGISLSAQVAASSDNIAASATGASGNGATAAQLAAFATTASGVLGNNTMREFFVSLASNVGLDVQGSQQDTDAHQTMADQADSARNSASGVNVDEEMISLMSQQQAYQAAARLVKVADEMIQVMLNLGA
jgi:flagellar hook-associated protein 1 FlgK